MYTPYEVRRGDIAIQKKEIDYIKIKIVPFIINFGGKRTIRNT